MRYDSNYNPVDELFGKQRDTNANNLNVSNINGNMQTSLNNSNNSDKNIMSQSINENNQQNNTNFYNANNMNSTNSTQNTMIYDNGYNSNDIKNKKHKKINYLVVFGILLFILITIVIVIFVIKEEVSILTDKIEISATGFEFDSPFDQSKLVYNLNIDTKKVQIKCTKKERVEGCNKLVDMSDKTSYDHIIKYTTLLGDVYTYTIHITRGEQKGPIKIDSLLVDNTDYTSGKNKVVVNAESENKKNLQYSFDGGNTWQESNEYEVEENTELDIVVKDEDNNITENKTVEVENIDKEKPTVTLSIKSKTTNKIVLYADARDETSGVSGYSWNNSEYTNNSTYEVTKAGTYTVKVKDEAGNVSEEAKIIIPESEFNKKVEKVKMTYTVTIEGNGASVEKTNVSCTTTESECTVTLPKINRDGWTIIGYSSTPNSQTSSYSNQQQIKITQDMKLYAITRKEIKVTYNSNGATLSGGKENCYIYNKDTKCKIKTPTITRSGWEGVGYSDNANATTAAYGQSQDIEISSNINLYAITSKKVIITLDKNGATSIGKNSIECSIYNSSNSCTVTLPTITITGGNVIGWSDDKNSTTAQYKVNEKISVSNNKTLYAITKKTVTYTITYDANGGINPPPKQTKTSGNPISISTTTPIKIGYKFLGWSTNKTGSVNYKSGDKYTSDKNLYLYAIWQDLYIDNTSYTHNSITKSDKLLFNKTTQSGIYNYAPTAIKDDNGEIHIFYVGNKDSRSNVDHIYHRTVKKNSSTGYYYSSENLLLTHSSSGWDSVQACDPTIIKGNFKYNGVSYKYLMVYLGVANHNNSLNEIGLAVSNNLNSQFIRVSTNAPFIKYPANSAWGVGQPTAVNLDGNDRVLISYTQGLTNKTSQYFGIYDLSNLNSPTVIKSPVEISTVGSLSYISNADIAIDLVNDKIWMTAHQGKTYEKNSVTGTTNYVPTKSMVMSKKLNLKSFNSLTDAVYNALTTSTNPWSSTELSNSSYLIHNTGFIRDGYGYINGTSNIYNNLLISTASKNGSQTDQLYSYQIRLY